MQGGIFRYMKKFILVVLALFSVVLSSCSNAKSEIVVTSFPGYDAARAVVGDDVSIKMLLKPGNDIHSYEPSGADVRAINESKLFIYVGGESDEWVESDILPNIGKDTKVVSMFDALESKLLLEDGEEDEYDEHVWTDPSNYKMVVEEVYKTLKEIYPDKAEKFERSLCCNKEIEFTATVETIPEIFNELVKHVDLNEYTIKYTKYVQARRHHKRRINKKWLKKYGYKEKIIVIDGLNITHKETNGEEDICQYTMTLEKE